MTRQCYICGRGPTVAATRSHAMNLTKRRVYPNLQTKKLDNRRHLVCTRCLKSLALQTK